MTTSTSNEAQYLYCIVDGKTVLDLGKVGLMDGEVTTLAVDGLAAVVSPVPYKELESSLANIMTHQKVVELARSKSTALPVRFGVIFKSKDGVKKLLAESNASYREKLSKLDGKDEYGVKVILSGEGKNQLKMTVGKGSPELGRLTRASAKAGKGTAYLLKLKAEEALKAESFRALEKYSSEVNDRLAKASADSRRLGADHEQIVLNAAYLVDRNGVSAFQEAVKKATEDVKPVGLELHLSGPWAPYSFC
jgi:hypothetical protein